VEHVDPDPSIDTGGGQDEISVSDTAVFRETDEKAKLPTLSEAVLAAYARAEFERMEEWKKIWTPAVGRK
jgi:hypothetical protein